MNTRMQTDTWISRAVIMLGLILMANVVGVLILRLLDRPGSEILVTLGFVAIGGLIRLWVSPLNRNHLD